MKSSWIRVVLAAAAVSMLLGTTAIAQQAASDDTGRKVKSRVNPAFPELARRMNVTGKVKLEVVIAPDGHVKSSRVIGGHPLLVQACQDAVRDWKFLPAAEESTQVLEFNFKD
jgi:TonB family protein